MASPFDGSKSFDIYDPNTGMVGASWTSMDGSNTFTAGVDSKTVQTLSYGGSDTQLLSDSGVQNDQVVYASGGLTTTDNLNGLTTTTQTTMGTGGTYSVTTTNPDGTSRKDSYVSGLLSHSQQLGTSGVQIADISYLYNSNRTLATSNDYTGVTSYTEFQDGSEASVKAPGQNQPQMVTSINPGTGDPTKVTHSNGTTTSQTENTLGQTATRSGAGVIASKFDYNPDGQLTSLTSYPGGDPTNSDDPKAAATTWQYDPASGLMTTKTYNDGSQNTYKYNSAGQLMSLTEPGSGGTNTTASFGYNAAGIQTSSTAIDSITGLVSSQVNALDDQGRPIATTSVDNGQVSTETNTYTALGQPQSETFGAAGNASVTHAYYPTTNYGTSGAPAALWSLTVTPGSGPSASQTYTYNSTTQRLRYVTINGLVRFNYGYLYDSNQVSSLSVGNVTITFTPDGSNASRVGGIAVTTSTGSTLYNASSIYYNQNNQIQSQTVLRTNADGSQSNDNLAYTYGTGTTDNGSDANSLTQVTDNGATTESYSYDGVGNFLGTSLGDVNSLNQYAALSYNLRGDVANDGTYAYTYDANDRMISVTPDAPAQGSLQLTYGYDSQGRRTWKDVCTWNATSGTWVSAYSRSYVYDGTQLVGELDQTGKLVTGYTWSPSGQLIAVTDYTQSTPKTYVAVIDASGNTVMLVDPTAGTVAASYTYDSYGNLLTASGPAQSVCSILGKGLYYDYEARSIGHALNRDVRLNTWYERDPAGEILGGPNVHAYLGGDPIDLSDTSGLLVSQIAEWSNEIGKKYIDPWVISKIQNHFGSSAATTAAQWIAGTRKLGIQLTIGTDATRQLGRLVDGVLDGSIAHTIDQRFAAANAVAQQPGGQGGALSVLFGMDNLPAGIYNAYPYPATGRPTTVGGSWARFQVGGQGVVNTLNTFTAVGGGVMSAKSFAGNVQLGMQEEMLANGARQPVPMIVDPSLRQFNAMRSRYRGMVINPFARSAGVAPAVEEELVTGGLTERTPQQLGMVAPPDHHIFPQQMRAWFADPNNVVPGFNIDQYTVTLPEWEHGALHAGGGPGLGGGWYNDVAVQAFQDYRNTILRPLTHDEVLEIGNQLRGRFQIVSFPVHPYSNR